MERGKGRTLPRRTGQLTSGPAGPCPSCSKSRAASCAMRASTSVRPASPRRSSDLPLKDSERPALARTPLEFGARNFRQVAGMAQVRVAYAAPDQTRDVSAIEARRTHSIEYHCRRHEPEFAEFAMKFERLGDRERLGGSDFDHCARFLVAQKTRDVVGLT